MSEAYFSSIFGVGSQRFPTNSSCDGTDANRHHAALTKIAIICHAQCMEDPMATMNVSLPDPMKDWVEAQTRTGRYSNASDYVRDLIRRDQERAAKIAAMQALVSEGLENAIGTRSMADLLEAAKAGR